MASLAAVIALDRSGFATAVAPTAPLVIHLADLAKAHADLLTRGPASPSSAHFAADPLMTKVRADDAKQIASVKRVATSSSTFSPLAGQPVYAVKTADGGALAFYSVDQVYVATVRPTSSATLRAYGVDIALLGTTEFRKLSEFVILQFCAQVPRTGQVGIRGSRTGLVGAKGG